MKTRTFVCAVLAAAVGGMTIGCDSRSGQVDPAAGRASQVPANTPAASPARPIQVVGEEPAAEPAPAARAAAQPPAPASPPAGGLAFAQLAVPTGQRTNSPFLVETFAPQEVLAGSLFDYKIRLTNLTDSNIDGVVLTASPLDIEVVGIGPRGRVNSGKATWDVGAVEARGARAFIIRGRTTKVGTLVPCAEVTFRNPRVCMPVRVVQPALRVVRTGPEEVLICDPITWRVIVTNSGTGTARNVVVREDLPDGLTAMDGGRTIVANVGDLGTDQAREVTMQARAAAPGKYTGRTVAAGGGLTAASEPMTVRVCQPMLAVAKTGPEMRYVGRPVAYTITVKNTGDGEARDTVLTDTVPAGMKLTSITEGGRQTPDGRIAWNLGALAPGAEARVGVSGEAGDAGTLTSSAVARAKCAEGSATAVTAVRGVPAILLEMVDDPDPVEIGTNTTYTTTITNQGTAPDGNIVVKCVIPEEEAYVSATGPTREMLEGQTVTFAPLPSLAPKAKAVYKVVVKGIKSGDVRFKVLLTSDMMTTPAMKTESTHVYGD